PTEAEWTSHGMEDMLIAAPTAIGERSRSLTASSSVRTQPLSSYRLPMVSAMGANRTTGLPPDFAGSRRNDLLLPCNTVESGVAVPLRTVQPWPGFSKEVWNKGVAA